MKIKSNIIEKASFIKDSVLSANDGILTTFAVIAGSYGASISAKTIIILGLANLFADGISMASGSYLGNESATAYLKEHNSESKFKPSAIKNSLIVFFAFVMSGFIPLLPYIFGSQNPFTFSILLVIFSMTTIGFLRAILTGKSISGSILETMVVGISAASVAFFIGHLSEKLIS